jgi:hypothetical protein
MRKSRRLAIKWSLIAVLSLGLMSLDFIRPVLFVPSQPESCSISRHFVERVNDTNSKIMEMAENFPSERYHFRPSGKSLSFAEQILRVASHNFSIINAIKGESEGIQLTIKEYPTKDRIIEVLEESMSELSMELTKLSESDIAKVEDFWAKSLSHSDEVYGQAVIYYQLNGLIPPSEKAVEENISKISVGGVTVQACQQLLKKAQYPLSRLSLRRLGNLLQ